MVNAVRFQPAAGFYSWNGRPMVPVAPMRFRQSGAAAEERSEWTEEAC